MVLSNHTDHVVNGETAVTPVPVSDLGSIASGSHAGRAVFHALQMRERFRRMTDLNRLYRFILTNVDSKLTEEDFLNVFKDLSNKGVGKLIIGRKLNPNRFRWYYNLKEAAEAALHNRPLTDLNQLPPKPRVSTKTKKAKVRRKRRTVSRMPKPTFTPYVPPAEPTQAPEPAPVSTSNPDTISAPGISINITLPPNASPSEVKALIDLAKEIAQAK